MERSEELPAKVGSVRQLWVPRAPLVGRAVLAGLEVGLAGASMAGLESPIARWLRTARGVVWAVRVVPAGPVPHFLFRPAHPALVGLPARTERRQAA